MATYKILNILVLAGFFVLECSGKSRIIGGIETSIEQRPYQASLQYKIKNTVTHKCGASIIGLTTLLTAAQCYDESFSKFLNARVGSTVYNAGGTVIKVKNFITHPDYNNVNMDYNVGLVTLNRKVTLGPKVAIIPLANTELGEYGFGVASGWGVTSNTQIDSPLNLREVRMIIVNRSTCQAIYPFLRPSQYCMGGLITEGISVCFGDSGGPVVENGLQYGITTSIGAVCTNSKIANLFSKTSTIRSWIAEMSGI